MGRITVHRIVCEIEIPDGFVTNDHPSFAGVGQEVQFWLNHSLGCHGIKHLKISEVVVTSFQSERSSDPKEEVSGEEGSRP